MKQSAISSVTFICPPVSAPEEAKDIYQIDADMVY
jgi:hypothetical protein